MMEIGNASKTERVGDGEWEDFVELFCLAEGARLLKLTWQAITIFGRIVIIYLFPTGFAPLSIRIVPAGHQAPAHHDVDPRRMGIKYATSAFTHPGIRPEILQHRVHGGGRWRAG